MKPNTSLSHLISVNAKWPHSCPKTPKLQIKIQMPIATVPRSRSKTIHIGKAYQDNGMSLYPIYANKIVHETA